MKLLYKCFRYCCSVVPVSTDWSIVLLCGGEGSQYYIEGRAAALATSSHHLISQLDGPS